ncbi:MAG: hypothetical protein AAF483_29105 [Planctomycetota bacterium]
MRERILTFLNDPNREHPQLRAALRRCAVYAESKASEEASVCVTAGANLALSYAEKGRQVLLLEPFWCSDEELLELQQCPLILPALMDRYDASAWAARKALESQKLGLPGLLRLHHWGAGYYLLPAWARKIELAMCLFSEVAEFAYATKNSSTLQFHLGFPGGGMAMLVFSANLPAYSYRSFSLICSNGAVYYDDHKNSNLTVPRQPGQTLAASTVRGEELSQSAAMLQDFFAWRTESPETAKLRHEKNWRSVIQAKELASRVSNSLKRGERIVHRVG